MVLKGVVGLNDVASPSAAVVGPGGRRRPKGMDGERVGGKDGAAALGPPVPGEDSRPGPLRCPAGLRHLLRFGRASGDATVGLRQDPTYPVVKPAGRSAQPGPLLGLGPGRPRRAGPAFRTSESGDAEGPLGEGSGACL